MRTRLPPNSDCDSPRDLWRSTEWVGWRRLGRWRLRRIWWRRWRVRWVWWWRRIRWWWRRLELVAEEDDDETRRTGEAASACVRGRASLGGAVRLGGGRRAQSEEVRLQRAGDRGCVAARTAARGGGGVEGVGRGWQSSAADLHDERVEILVGHFPDGIRRHTRAASRLVRRSAVQWHSCVAV